MMEIESLSSVLPIIVNGDVLQFVRGQDAMWYTRALQSAYYNKYADLNFRAMQRKVVYSTLKHLADEYEMRIETLHEVRLILSRNNKQIGGCTVYEDKGNLLSLSYFVIPSYQGMGIAFNMMHKLIRTLDNSQMTHKGYSLSIREDNERSLRLANKLGFNEVNQVQGKTKINKIFYLGRQTWKI